MVVLAAWAAAPSLRRTGCAGQALHLLQEAHAQLAAGAPPTAPSWTLRAW
ncbi:hypothetical protein [Streptomyces griseofuscus]